MVLLATLRDFSATKLDLALIQLDLQAVCIQDPILSTQPTKARLILYDCAEWSQVAKPLRAGPPGTFLGQDLARYAWGHAV